MKKLSIFTITIFLSLATQNIYSGPTCSRPEIINEQSQENINIPQILSSTDQEGEVPKLLELQQKLQELPKELSDEGRKVLSQLQMNLTQLQDESSFAIHPLSAAENQLIVQIVNQLEARINPQFD